MYTGATQRTFTLKALFFFFYSSPEFSKQLICDLCIDYCGDLSGGMVVYGQIVQAAVHLSSCLMSYTATYELSTFDMLIAGKKSKH